MVHEIDYRWGIPTTNTPCFSGAYYPISTDTYINSSFSDLYTKMLKEMYSPDDVHPNYNYIDDHSEKSYRKSEYFSMDDLKYSDIAKKNLKVVIGKRKIKNLEDCISIIDSLAPSSVELVVKKIINKNNKISVLKMLRKIKISDPIVLEQ